MKTSIGGFVLSGKKGMKKYPIWVRETIFEEIKEGKSKNQISKEYGISRYAIHSWIGARPEKNVCLLYTSRCV